MNYRSKELPVKKSSARIGKKSIKSEYSDGQCTFIVTSKFNGKTTLSDLIYNLVIKSEQSKALHIG